MFHAPVATPGCARSPLGFPSHPLQGTNETLLLIVPTGFFREDCFLLVAIVSFEPYSDESIPRPSMPQSSRKSLPLIINQLILSILCTPPPPTSNRQLSVFYRSFFCPVFWLLRWPVVFVKRVFRKAVFPPFARFFCVLSSSPF